MCENGVNYVNVNFTILYSFSNYVTKFQRKISSKCKNDTRIRAEKKKKEKRKICVLTRFEGTAVPILECTADLKESKTGAVELALKIQ